MSIYPQWTTRESTVIPVSWIGRIKNIVVLISRIPDYVKQMVFKIEKKFILLK